MKLQTIRKGGFHSTLDKSLQQTIHLYEVFNIGKNITTSIMYFIGKWSDKTKIARKVKVCSLFLVPCICIIPNLSNFFKASSSQNILHNFYGDCHTQRKCRSWTFSDDKAFVGHIGRWITFLLSSLTKFCHFENKNGVSIVI